MLTRKLKALWRGEIPLVKAFWLYFMGGFILIWVTSLLFVQYAIYFPLQANTDVIKITLLLSVIIWIPYQIVAIVGVWMSSNCYTGSKVLKILAKAYVILAIMHMKQNVFTLLAMLTLF